MILLISFAVWSQTPNLTVDQSTPDSDNTNNRNCSIASNPKGDIMIVLRNGLRGMKYYFKKNSAGTGILADIPSKPYPESLVYKIQ